MSSIAIKCDRLSKQYRIGERESYKALRDVITDAASAPFRRLSSAIRNGNGTASPNPTAETRDSFWALQDVSFEVKRGEVVGIIGRNGAGKSTLLKILSRITKPTRGHAEIHGRVGSLLEVGTGFHPELTGRENIYLNAAILGMRKTEVTNKFDEIVSFAEVEKFIDTPVKRYSSGMYVRLAFAVAAHMETEVLLVDEVLAVGDTAFQNKCLGKIQDIAGQGRTVLFVSHNMGAVQNLCTVGTVLEGGKSSFQGTAVEAVEFYHHSIINVDIKSRSLEPHIIYEASDVDRADLAITRIDLCDASGNPQPVVSTWDNVIFRIHFRSNKKIQRGSVILQLATVTGAKLFLLSTQPDGLLPLSIEVGEQTVECNIKSLPVAAGEYVVGAGLAIPHVEMLWWQPEIARLRVNPRDVYGSGLAPAFPRSLIAPEHSWRVVT